MAYAPVDAIPHLLGCFREMEHGHLFEYKSRPLDDMQHFAPTFPHLVYVGPDHSTRPALVKRTVAHVVIDEDAAGQPIVVRWHIRSHRVYGQ